MKLKNLYYLNWIKSIMLNLELKYAILIIAYNRPKHLEKLFSSLEDYCLLESSQIVIVQQVGNIEV